MLGSKEQATAAWDLAFFIGGQKGVLELVVLLVVAAPPEEEEEELAVVAERLAG